MTCAVVAPQVSRNHLFSLELSSICLSVRSSSVSCKEFLPKILPKKICHKPMGFLQPPPQHKHTRWAAVRLCRPKCDLGIERIRTPPCLRLAGWVEAIPNYQRGGRRPSTPFARLKKRSNRPARRGWWFNCINYFIYEGIIQKWGTRTVCLRTTAHTGSRPILRLHPRGLHNHQGHRRAHRRQWEKSPQC